MSIKKIKKKKIIKIQERKNVSNLIKLAIPISSFLGGKPENLNLMCKNHKFQFVRKINLKKKKVYLAQNEIRSANLGISKRFYLQKMTIFFFEYCKQNYDGL